MRVLPSGAMGAFTLLVAAAPSVLLLAYFYLRDRFEREPLGHLTLAYALGMYAMVAARGMATAAAGWVSGTWLDGGTESARLFDAFVLAGFIEELSKWVILMAAVYHWSEVDEPLDGLIYGVAVSLGFATLENIIYLQQLGLDVFWARAIFAVPAHALFGGAMGYYAGRAKFDHDVPGMAALQRRRHLLVDHLCCLLVPVLFHGTYDFALLHGLDWKAWVSITVISVGLWAFVLRRIHRAQRASPYRPKTMPPARHR
ncbi:MAG TPA: PrsW family glutamic-type intramembrane protease [Polyangia bacterium]|nr:PrsW family glutamic-type intramembrane protease [Polyangia bacterium]